MIGQYTLQQWILYFYVYCFLGWIFESCYVSFRKKEWVNRGFLHGPFLPIYGSGAVMMLFVSEPFKNNLILTYFAGVVGATLLELVTGAAMEALLKVRYWDYSNQKFNYKGYICLSSSVAWGIFDDIDERSITSGNLTRACCYTKDGRWSLCVGSKCRPCSRSVHFCT